MVREGVRAALGAGFGTLATLTVLGTPCGCVESVAADASALSDDAELTCASDSFAGAGLAVALAAGPGAGRLAATSAASPPPSRTTPAIEKATAALIALRFLAR